MLNSLLNASNVSIDSLILDIFIILGVVIAGALIVYFLWEAVSTIVNKTKKSGTSVKEPTFQPERKKSVKQEDVFVSDFKLDAEHVKEEESVIEPLNLLDESKLVDVDENKAEQEKAEVEKVVADEERENAERRAYLEARRQELIRRMQAEMEEESPVEEVAEQPVEETVENEEAEAVVEAEEVAPVEEEISEMVETDEEENVDALEDERKALAVEKEKYETMVRELEEAKKALAEQSREIVEKEPVVKIKNQSIEELQEKLANVEERLKVTEKEFKQCKKEYIPLRRVWKTHEKDENKLRRKEALVAKQKVLLYGVNNYADIDEEKAKKLAEDLDLLDGLKLSVQHCEEVMKKNEERYPLLEKMYDVLSIRNEELKNDIVNYKAEIAKLEAEQNSESEE